MTTSDRLYWQTARGEGPAGKPLLTPRQLEALELYDRGLPYTTIGLHLGVSRERARQLVTRAGQKVELQLRTPAA